jgi:hypothetical protein
MANDATYDVTGVWRFYWYDDFEGGYSFYGEYLKCIGTSTSGTYEWYSNFKGDSNPVLTYSVDGTEIFFNDTDDDYFGGIFENKNTIEGYYQSNNYESGGETFSWIKLERVVNDQPPFGSFGLPANGASVSGSIPISGWALDDTMITSIKIYYSDASAAAAKDPDNWYLIEDDVNFLFGARPDVAYTYWDNYYCEYAGWGYMCLTYFLPNGGNGPFMLHVVVTDIAGNSTTWSVSLNGDNAHRVKPFGAIDTPTQGGSASGSNFVNWGWVLTPQPNSIPTDGSSIDVWVDGVKIGNPAYNVYRSDIASLFPGYANSNGAIGYFYLDTTAYANGVHTIQWTAKDSGGNSDGIGSRYFSIQNTGGAKASSMASAAGSNREISGIGIDALKDLPTDYSSPVKIKQGFVKDSEAVEIYPDIAGLTNIEIKEMERLELDFSNCTSNSSKILGYMKVGDKLYPLPVGSTLAAGERKFYWQPGPGFIGEYLFVFIEEEQGKTMNRKDINVKIVPKFEI